MFSGMTNFIHINLPNVKIILKNGKELDFYVDNKKYNAKKLTNIINNADKFICIENTIIMKEEIRLIM